MREVEGSGEGVDEAVDAALAELGASRDEVDVEVLADGRSGALGVEGAPTRVRVTMRDSPDAESADDSMRSPADSGAGDGDCDACPLTGGFRTQDEMFVLFGNYWVTKN